MAKLSKELRMGIHNRFDIEVVDAKTGEVKQRAQAFNVICNGYFNVLTSYWNSEHSYGADRVHYGTGTGTPSVSDATLFNYAGYKDVNSSGSTIDVSRLYAGIAALRYQFILGVADAVGVSISEVGLYNSSRSILYTHAMLQDMNGNPISITKTGTDIINIYATVYLHFNQSGDIHVYDISGDSSVSQPFSLLRKILAGSPLSYRNSCIWSEGYGGACMCAGKNFVFDGYSSSSPVYRQGGDVFKVSGPMMNYTDITADPTNKTITISKRFDVDKGNIGGIKKIGFCTGRYNSYYGGKKNYQFMIESGKTSIPPKSITGESVGVGDGTTLKFRTKTDCPYNATVYINGIVKSSGVRVRKAPCYGMYDYNTPGDKMFLDTVFAEDVNIPSESDTSTNEYVLLSGVIYRNNLWEEGIGAPKVYGSSSGNRKMFGSNDGESWTLLHEFSNSIRATLTASDWSYKYIKFDGGGILMEGSLSDSYDGYNIIFDTPPAAGDVITIDYTTDYIPKDADHVLDITLTLTFGEWQGE